MRLLAAAIGLILFAFQAAAQHNHGAGHHEYMGWSSRKVANCCNEQDCSGVADANIRQTGTGPELLIDGQWCPVLREHYLTRGRSPDWQVPHACIRNAGQGCDRLLCFTPAGGF